MFAMFTERMKDEEGFTLIELMVVVLIIAILIAIAIPTFLGARQRAQHRSAQSNLRNALTAEKTGYTDGSVFLSGGTGSTLAGIEPSLSFLSTSPAAGTNQVETVLGTNSVCLSAQTVDNLWYSIMDEATGSNPGTYYNNAEVTAGNCDTAITAGLAKTTPTLGGW